MQKETNCNIMFLVHRNDDYRLMSFKSNPWLRYMSVQEEQDSDVVKQSLFIFSGKLKLEPSAYLSKDKKNFFRRFGSDRIQSAELITKRLGSVDQYMLII